MGDHRSAQPVLSQLLRQNPQHREANLLLARHYFATHEYQAALEVVENRLASNLRDYDFRYLFALILRAQGKTEEAATHMGFVEASDAAMARIRIAMDQTRDEPQRADTRFEIGIELMELGFRVEAANWLRSVLEVEPNHLAAHDALAKFYHDEGQPALALRHEVARQRLKIK
jgi:Tfp pilus assembly protein PilF